MRSSLVPRQQDDKPVINSRISMVPFASVSNAVKIRANTSAGITELNTRDSASFVTFARTPALPATGAAAAAGTAPAAVGATVAPTAAAVGGGLAGDDATSAATD